MNFDELIDIQQPIESRNGVGEMAVTWQTYKKVWAALNFKGGREGFYARQVVATGDVVFKIRAIPGITAKMRILHDQKVYDIQHLAGGLRSGILEITAKSHDNE
jgi:SPP1 family predicted phage head-tail adaptor